MSIFFIFVISPQQNYTFKSPNFYGIKYKKQSLHDLFINNPVGYYTPKKSLKKIQHIQPQFMSGTKCKGSIPLRNFWNFIEKNKYIKQFGYSTNKDGFGNSFLKAKAKVPISTSYVHDCSVMYLYNRDKCTHALYHALPNCPEEVLDYMVKFLMPEGFDIGAIIPGDGLFYKSHKNNLKNMLKTLKQANPEAVINVYHETSKYPEIVGLNGSVFEIPNTNVLKQIKSGTLEVEDHGQATFNIVDLQGYNTFENIFLACKTIKALDKIKSCFLEAGYPDEILDILFKAINKKKEILEMIESITNAENLEKAKTLYPQKCFEESFLIQKEKLLINDLKKIKFINQLKSFYHKIKFDLVTMNRLMEIFEKKKNEILHK